MNISERLYKKQITLVAWLRRLGSSKTKEENEAREKQRKVGSQIMPGVGDSYQVSSCQCILHCPCHSMVLELALTIKTRHSYLSCLAWFSPPLHLTFKSCLATSAWPTPTLPLDACLSSQDSSACPASSAYNLCPAAAHALAWHQGMWVPIFPAHRIVTQTRHWCQEGPRQTLRVLGQPRLKW